jgi:hypothetical protein
MLLGFFVFGAAFASLIDRLASPGYPAACGGRGEKCTTALRRGQVTDNNDCLVEGARRSRRQCRGMGGPPMIAVRRDIDRYADRFSPSGASKCLSTEKTTPVRQ